MRSVYNWESSILDFFGIFKMLTQFKANVKLIGKLSPRPLPKGLKFIAGEKCNLK